MTQAEGTRLVTVPLPPAGEVVPDAAEPASVLLVEDSDTHALLTTASLVDRPSQHDDGMGEFLVERVATLAEATTLLTETDARFDAVLLDLTLPDARGIEALTALLGLTDLPIVVMTGSDDIDRAVAAMRGGAQDYLLKTSTAPTDLARAMRFAIERAEMANELKRTQEARDVAVSRLNDFLQLTAHEMLSPMTSVYGMGEVLTRKWDDVPGEQRRRMVRSITSMAGVVVTVSKQLLELAKERGGEVPPPETADCVLSDAVEDAAMMADVVPELVGEDVVVRVDPDHLRVILRNLFSNARRHGKEPIEVLTRRSSEGGVVVTVSDHGPGIPEEARDKLFTRWSGSDSEGSHGLGLYLARLLADANGGSLEYVGDSDGAAFDISLQTA